MWHSRNPSSKFTCIIRKHYQKFILSKSIFNIFIKNLFKIKYEFLYRTLLNTWVLLMIFNEILISQDSFTETNVTRKRSIVGNSYLYSKVILFEISCFAFILFTYSFIFMCLWKIWKMITTPHYMLKWYKRYKMLEKEISKIIHTKIQIEW